MNTAAMQHNRLALRPQTAPGVCGAMELPAWPSRVAPGAMAFARWRTALAMALLVLAGPLAHAADTIGTVDTAFQWIGRDHDIIVEAYDDPGVTGVTCYVSRARVGGIKGTLGLAEDKAEASIACRQVGPISFPKASIKPQEEVFTERMSLLFKRLRIVRMVDAPRNTLVYLTYSDKLIEGSPQNSVTAVPVDRDTPIPVKK